MSRTIVALNHKNPAVSFESSKMHMNSNSVKSFEDSSTKSPLSKFLKFSPYCNPSKRRTLGSIYASKQLLKLRPRASSSSIKTLEDKLAIQLEEFAMKEPITRERFGIYKSSLDEIINMDSSLSPMLRKIGIAYEQFLSLQEAEATAKAKMVTELSIKLEEERILNKQLQKRFKRLISDNIGMTETLKDHVIQIEGLKMELCQNPQSLHSQSQVHNLNRKLSVHSQKLTKLTKKYQLVKLSEQKLLKAVDILREQQYPVDAIMQQISSDYRSRPRLIIPSISSSNMSLDRRSSDIIKPIKIPIDIREQEEMVKFSIEVTPPIPSNEENEAIDSYIFEGLSPIANTQEPTLF